MNFKYHNKFNNGENHICPDCANLFTCPWHTHKEEVDGWVVIHHEHEYLTDLLAVLTCPLFADSTDCKGCEGCNVKRFYGENNNLCEMKKERRVRYEARR